jgi:peptidyl-prolyl cis-trans isomerase D
MFDFIRNHRRWMQLILLLLIVPSFFLVGVSGYSSFMNSEPEMAKVGSDTITQSQFDAARRDQLERARQQLGANFDPAQIDTPALRQGLLDQLISQRLLAAVAIDNRFSVSDETLRNTIASIESVQDNGHFSPERYRQVLAAQGMTPASFEAGLRRDLAVGRVIQPVATSVRLPDEVAASVESALTQVRTVQTRRYAATDFRAKINVAPADIQAWYDANKQQLQTPENVAISYVVLDEAAATDGVQVKDEDIEKHYQQNKARFGQPERRRVSHILIQVPAKASEEDRRAARAKAEGIARDAAAHPDQFAEMAKMQSQDPGSSGKGGDLGWIGQGQYPAPLESAIFALKDQQVSGVVESPAGFHVFKIAQIQPASIKPLADVKAEITGEVRKQLAADRFATMATALTKVVNDQRESLQPAADAAGLKIRKASGITRTGVLGAADAGPDSAATSPDAETLDSPRVRQILFSSEVLHDKLNSGVIELAPDRMVAVHVDSVTPAQIPPLEKVSERVRTILLDQKSAQAAEQAGKDALAALQKTAGTPVAAAGATPAPAAPAADTAGFGPAKDVTRQNPEDLSRGILEAVFRAPDAHLPAYAGVQEGNDYVVARLEKVAPGKIESADKDALRKQLSDLWAQAEQDAVTRTLREQYKVKISPDAEKIIRGEKAAQG